MYKIYDKQTYEFFGGDTIENATPLFKTLHEVLDQLVSFHSADCDVSSLEGQSLADIASGFEWEILTDKGEEVSFDELLEIKS